MAVVLKQLMTLITKSEGTDLFEAFMKTYTIKLDQFYYDHTKELIDSMVKETNYDPALVPPYKDADGNLKNHVEGESAFSLNADFCKSNARTMIYMYIVADIETSFKRYGVNTMGKSGPAKRITYDCKVQIKEDLQKRLDKTFTEIEKFINNIIAERNGIYEGVNTQNEDIMDLSKRDVTIKPEPQQTKDGEEVKTEEPVSEEQKKEEVIKNMTEAIGTGAVSSV